MSNRIPVLKTIIEDCEKDVKEYDGRRLSGHTVGEIHGILEAKIEALAKILLSVVEELEK